MARGWNQSPPQTPVPQSQAPLPPRLTTPQAMLIVKDGVPYSATLSVWAPLCKEWKDRGVCKAGASCPNQHLGFRTHDDDGQMVNRCVICGAMGHMKEDCVAPGGDKDPNEKRVWKEYDERKQKAIREGKYPFALPGKGQQQPQKGKDGQK